MKTYNTCKDAAIKDNRQILIRLDHLETTVEQVRKDYLAFVHRINRLENKNKKLNERTKNNRGIRKGPKGMGRGEGLRSLGYGESSNEPIA